MTFNAFPLNLTSTQKYPQNSHSPWDSPQSPYPSNTHINGNPRGNLHTHGSPVYTPTLTSVIGKRGISKQKVAGCKDDCHARLMSGFHHSVAVLLLPFRRSAVVTFRCSVKITQENSVPLQP